VTSPRIPATEIMPENKLQIDLGMDSISRTELLTKLEMKLGLSIPHDAEGKLFTVRDVIQLVETARKSGQTSKGGRGLLNASSGASVEEGLQDSISKSVLQGMFRTTMTVFMNTYISVDATGVENVPASGPYILASSHNSHLDSVAIRTVLGARSKKLHVMGARDYFFDTNLKSWFFSNFLNVLPFDREENIAESLASCRMVLDRGRGILLFPEGTRSVSGELQPFKSGIGVLGVELDVPVIPVYVRGTYEALPKGKALPRPKKIEVHFGAPADLSALRKLRGGASMTDVYRRAAAELRDHVERLANMPR
jgi:long-chain acyl-CoA synthetase